MYYLNNETFCLLGPEVKNKNELCVCRKFDSILWQHFSFSEHFTMSLQEEEFGSDTDDDDYIPDCDPVVGSEEENSGDEEGAQDDAPAEGGVACKKKRKKKTPEAMKRKKTTHGGRGFMFEEENAGEGPVDWKAEVEKEKAELNKEVEKKKTEDIWAEFKRDTGGKPKPKSTGGGLASVLALAPPATNAAPAKPTSRFGSLFDNVEKSKKMAAEGEQEVVKEKPKNRFGSLFDAPPKEEQPMESEGSDVKGSDKVEITKVFDFAGEVVKVSKQVGIFFDNRIQVEVKTTLLRFLQILKKLLNFSQGRQLLAQLKGTTHESLGLLS